MTTGLTGIIVKIDEFDPAKCKFSVYISRFLQYLLVNNIDAKLHLGAFIAVMGDIHYQLLTNLLAPDDPASKNFDELVTALQTHFESSVLVVAERQKFNARRQAR